MFKILACSLKAKEVRQINIEELALELKKEDTSIFVDLANPSEQEYEKLAALFGFHHLTIDDTKKDFHLPKIDEYTDYLFVIWQSLNDIPKTKRIESAQVSFYLGENFLVAVHKEELVVMDEIVKKTGEDPKYLTEGLDRLLHMCLDEMADNYMPFIDKFSERADILEDEIFQEAEPEQLKELFSLKHKLLDTRKIIIPQRDIAIQLSRLENKFIKAQHNIYFRDIFDHLMRITDLIDSTRDIISGAMDIYLSQSSNKLNEIMKKLTVAATILLPLTVITGIYGMNFKYMPELRHPYGYFIVLVAMVAFSAIMFTYFKKKKWW